VRRTQEQIEWDELFAVGSVEDIPSIVATDLYSKGAPQGRLSRRWSLGDDAYVSISARPEEQRATCSVTAKFGPDLMRFSRNIEVTWTRVGRASRRAWIHCGAMGCDRKCHRLYIVANNLVCRQCAGLRYESKNRPAHDRSRVRADKLRGRLGAEPGFGAPLPSIKPKGMHRSTFDRLCHDLYEEERRFAELLPPVVERQVAALLKRLEALEKKQGAALRLSGSSSIAAPDL